MKKKMIVVISLLITSPALGKPIEASDQEQQAILQICEAANLSPLQSMENRTAIGQWCLAWRKRVSDAAQQVVPPAPPPQPNK